MAWFLVFEKLDSDLEFLNQMAKKWPRPCVWLIEMCHVSQYEHFELLNRHV
jgi:hypothetical protein